MYPTRDIALAILNESNQINPGPWKAHSLVVGECAEKIAKKIKGMDTEKAYVLGLLHDIGRRFGGRHMGHIFDGFTYMNSLGYDEVARVCLSHSFAIQNVSTYIGNIDTSPEETETIKTNLNSLIYDDYDRLIQLCDSVSMANGVVDIEVRMEDVASRYNGYPESIRQKNRDLKCYFEGKAATNIYVLISNDKSLWGK